MKKKAQGHIEMIVSFLLFAGVIIFLLLVLTPLAKTKEVSTIDDIQRIIIQNLSSEVGKLAVIVKNQGDCYSLASVLPNYGSKFIEINESSRVYAVYFSKDFSNGNIGCSGPLNFSLGVYSKENILVYERISDLALNYNNNYEENKKSLGITNDFAFSFKPFGGAEIANLSVSRNLPTGVEREAKEYPVRVLKTSGNDKGVKEYILNIMSW
jgi:hypothetical protein